MAQQVITSTVCDICGNQCSSGAEKTVYHDNEQYIISVKHVPSFRSVHDICPNCLEKILKGEY